jgi:hypothetical protein
VTSNIRRSSILGLLALGHAALAGAQSGPDVAHPRAVSDTVPAVTAIAIRRQGVFDSVEATNWISRLANTLHARTRASVVRRELLFHVGDRFDSSLVAESARNLRGLGIFRSVAIDSETTDSGLVARVTTGDGWSTLLDVTLESTGSQLAWGAEFYETNFLGTNSGVLLKYDQDVDRSYARIEFTRPRLIAGTIDTRFYFEDRSDGHDAVVAFSKPFFSLASRNGADIFIEDFGGRVFRFTGGQSIASDTVERRLTLVRLNVATAWRADTRGYVRIGVTAQVRRDDAVGESAVAGMPRSVTAAIGPSLEWQHARYVVTRNYEHLGEQEDVDLSARVQVNLLAAARVLGYAHDGIGPSASIRLGTHVPGGFGFAEGHANGVYSATGLDSGTAVVGATTVIKPGGDRQRLLLHIEQSWSRGAAIGSEFDLGFRSGPRAFPSHAFTGDRSWFATAEYRYMLFPELAKVAAIGIAAFAERGGAWFAGAPSRNGTDLGLGFRIGPTRQADLRTVRIDLARRLATDVQPAGWVVVLGKGFTFRTAL